MSCCIYQIKNIINNNSYVGSAMNFNKRRNKHKGFLNKGIHHSVYLQSAWKKYGEDFFEFIVLENILDKNDLIKKEQYYIDILRPAYNMCPTAGSRLGTKHSEEVKDKMKKSQKKRFFKKTLSEEHKRKISQTLSIIKKGKRLPESVLLRAREVRKGICLSLQHRRKISQSHRNRLEKVR